MTVRFEQEKVYKEHNAYINKAFNAWADSLTWWKLCKIGFGVFIGAILVLLVFGLVVGVPVWMLYKLFFVVLP